MDINLAPLRYRNILLIHGGPLDKIAVTDIGTPEHPQYEAVAFLSPSHVPAWHRNSPLYNTGHGGGTHRLRNVACHIAISEAMERWAFLQTVHGPLAGRYGFDVEPSTSGMAAFPGLTTETARIRADWEAVERWALLEWWNGKLSATLTPGSSRTDGTLLLSLSAKDRRAVILWSTLQGGNTAYGFAAADSTETAIKKARIEQARNVVVLNRFFEGHRPVEEFIADEDLPVYDRRLVFFSTPAGKQVFWENVGASTATIINHPGAQKIIDSEIPGPWSRYAAVWRTLYVQGSAHLDKSRRDIFLF